MTGTPRYAVLGAGNGGHGLAAEIALRGRNVALFELPRFEDRIAPIRAAGGITVDSHIDHFPGGKGEHLAKIDRVTTDMGEALADADIVIPVVPAQYHHMFVEAAAPHLKEGQLIVVYPGGVGGTLYWRKALAARGVTGLQFAQSADSLYAGRVQGPARLRLNGKKKKAEAGIFPNADRDAVMARLADMFPELVPSPNALIAGLSGPGMLLHPLPMLMNAVRTDREAPFTYDAYDITPSVARAIDALDAERVAIVTALGGAPVPIKDILTDYYGTAGDTFYDTVCEVPAYRGGTAPENFQHRYITEEVPTQVVPTALLGEVLGVPTPVMRATANLAAAINGEDYWKTGWTLEALGLAGLDRDGMLQFLETGTR